MARLIRTLGFIDRITERLDALAGGDVPPAVREELELARAMLERGDVAEAEERLRDLARRYPRLAAVHLQLGVARLKLHDAEEAVSAFGRAADLEPSSREAWQALGELLSQLGRVEPARDALRRALALTTDEAERGRAHAALGRLHARGGQPARAVRELRKAAGALPDDLEIAGELGRALAAAGDPEAGPWLERAATAPDADAALVIEAARLLSRPALAEHILRTALERSPADERLRAALARTLAESGRPADALPLALQAVTAAPEDAGALEALRATFVHAARWKDALDVARRAGAAGHPVSTSTWVELALGARDAAALGEAPADEDALHAAAQAFAAGQATRPELLLLAAWAPDEEARRFVLQAAAPPPPQSGNLFALLGFAHELCVRNAELATLAPSAARALEAFDRPLLIAVMGEFNAGKSSLVNALCGAEVAPVGVTPTTATVNVLRYGPPGGRVLYHDGSARELAGDEVAPFLRALSPAVAATVRTVEVFWPVEQLRRVEIVDTPGLNSILPEHERIARTFLVEADAILWVFAVGQAAKASERHALGMARSAGKRVLGVLNKVDRAEPAEVEEVSRHVSASFGEALDSVVPFSARQALAARRTGDAVVSVASGLERLEGALDERFFAHARTLKRSTALGWLHRFVAEAARLVPPLPAAGAADEGELGRLEQELHGALAHERVALRGRIAEVYRAAAYELRDLVRPRRWLFGEHRAEPADREFVLELLDDSLRRASEKSGAALLAAARSAVETATWVLPAVERTVRAALDRFAAYVRGALEGGTVDRFFDEDLPRLELDVAAIQSALSRRAPDPEEPFFRPLERQLRAELGEARARLRLRQSQDAAERVLHQESLRGPLDALRAAVANLDPR